ncbi:lipase family alpha/beta hydrolase [Dethiothermospora halolimnae]|uniref:lipase family alpha/beta hydrolase n=1 Tax=Dethiothermospora halolimnae TaxID=3114390 RepID=UPI003CCC0094
MMNYNIQTNKKLPLVFIPGIFGSLGDDIIPGTGEFSFGPASYIYDPFIKSLEGMGYKKEVDLFVVHYDWRKGNYYSGTNYLIPELNRIKQIYKTNKVNIVCHSMGGLVARAYIQSDLYNYDINKLIMIGTPNAGTVKAYYFWEGGELPYDKVNGNVFFKVLWEGFVWIFKKVYKEKQDINFLKKFFPVAKELLPSREYGEYLFYKDDKDFIQFISHDRIQEKNSFLNHLNSSVDKLYSRIGDIHIIVGKGIETSRFICVNKVDSDKELWIDGKPGYVITSPRGDGTVISSSVASIFGRKLFINGDHGDILLKSVDKIKDILNIKTISRRQQSFKNKVLYSIIARDVKNIEIHKINKKISINNKWEDNYKGLTVIKVGENSYWLIIDYNYFNKSTIRFDSIKTMYSEIIILKGEKNKGVKKVSEVNTKDYYELSL